jgi:hypothetical protein
MYGGLNLKNGITLRPYGGTATSTDPFFSSVTVLYGFEDANFTSGVHNDGSLGAGTVTAAGVVPNSSFFVAGAQSAAFNQNGPSSNNGIFMGNTTDVLGAGDFTLEAFIRDPGTAFFQLFSCGITNNTSNRLNLDFPVTNAVAGVFQSATTVTSGNNVRPANVFFHYAFVFENSTSIWRAYVNGALVLNGTNGFGRVGGAYLGQHINNPQPVSGPQYLDEVRITRVARYTGASFTVPAVPFPRS